MGIRVPVSQAPIPQPSGALPSPDTGTAARAAGQLAATLGAIGERIAVARNNAEADALSFRLANDLAEQVASINRDVDPRDAPEAIATATEAMLGDILEQSGGNAAVASQVTADFRNRALAAQATVRAASHRRNVAATQAAVADSERSLQERFVAATNSDVRDAVLVEHADMIQQRVTDGLIAPDVADGRIQNFIHGANTQRVAQMMRDERYEELAVAFTGGGIDLPPTELLRAEVALGSALNARDARVRDTTKTIYATNEATAAQELYTASAEDRSAVMLEIRRTIGTQFSPEGARRLTNDFELLAKEDAQAAKVVTDPATRMMLDAMLAGGAINSRFYHAIAPTLSPADRQNFASRAFNDRLRRESQALAQLGEIIGITTSPDGSVFFPDKFSNEQRIIHAIVYGNMIQAFNNESDRIGAITEPAERQAAIEARRDPFEVLTEFQQLLLRDMNTTLIGTPAFDSTVAQQRIATLETERISIMQGFGLRSAAENQRLLVIVSERKKLEDAIAANANAELAAGAAALAGGTR